MKLGRTWETIRDTVEEFDLPLYLKKTILWVQRHPRTMAAGGLVLALAVLLAQTPREAPVEPDAYNGESPLFV